ncbi:hypothetical protein ABW19_dt0207913 [Dactylella cylindrospora]|nr:hypothetical protein ABW19_dt0207913 [Dactylella cylindrospora]
MGCSSNYYLDLQNLAVDLLLALQNLRASRLLSSPTGGKPILADLSSLNSAIILGDFDPNRIEPLLNAILDSRPDIEIWSQVYSAITEATPPPRPTVSSLQQTPWLHKTSSFVNSSEHRKYVDDVLREELGSIYVGLRGFYGVVFGGVTGLKTASEIVFKKCMEGTNPIFDQGWIGWPENANQDAVLGWFAEVSEKLAAFAEDCNPTPTPQRRLLTQPNQTIDGSTGQRKMDVGYIRDSGSRKGWRCHWSQILIPGELKSNPSADKALDAWLDLGRYAREVLAAQDTRRFVLGFTMCGSFMRIWEFDRLGGIASEQFDINKDGQQFVYTILGFLWMNEEQLGFDPTIISSDGRRYIDIERDGVPERLIIDRTMKRAPCIAGHATTCWKAHSEREPQTPLVIKDSWQFTEREEEGELVRGTTDAGVVNVARYYHHETVQVSGLDDDIRNNVRNGLDVTTATNYKPERPAMTPGAGTTSTPRKVGSTAGQKRSSSQISASLPPKKRSSSASLMKTSSNPLPNRVHRRVILRDYGKAIYKATSRAALLGALEGCIAGHESLYQAGFLHRDISINNLMINEDKNNPSWPSFLIDLDLAIKVQREAASGAQGKTGTRAFMAIGVLLGEHHSFMHDLESFFWVLFWICIHYHGPGNARVVPLLDKWNYVNTEELALLKKGQISDEEDFLKFADTNFTAQYQPLAPWVNRLRRKVFPNGERWKKPNQELYSSMKEILREARNDPKVLAN